MTASPTTGPSRTSVIAAVVLVGLLVVGVVVASRFAPGEPAPDTRPVALVPVDAPDAGSDPCAALLAALPGELPDSGAALPSLPIAEPAPPGTAVWGDRVAEPVVLRCGLRKPPELEPTSALRQVSGAQWLPIEGDVSVTWFLVDRPVYVALTVPATVGTGPLQTVSEVVVDTLAAQRVSP